MASVVKLRAQEAVLVARRALTTRKVRWWDKTVDKRHAHWKALREEQGAGTSHVKGAWHDLEHARELRARWYREWQKAGRELVSVRRSLRAAKPLKVRRPDEFLRASVRNQSSRGGVRPRLIVLHSTESHNRPGTADVVAIVNWFDNPAAQASSHVVVDGEGQAARCVKDSAKAWTQANYNPQALSIEQIGWASQAVGEWPAAQLDTVAKYVAFWAKTYGIPLVHSTTSGVCQHSDLGTAGGGHHDCGPGYPFDRVLDQARAYLRAGW